MSTGASGGRALLAGAAVVVAAVVGAALWVLDTPGAQREMRLDARRVDDLRRIERAVRQYAEETGALPGELSALATQPGRRLDLADPVTGRPYEYERIDARRFRLCAEFLTDTAERGGGGQDWPHARGRHCAQRSLDRN
ncbi:hypothetical protein [Coralloluteibacterium thermophilus]|uniref:Type II secretion system protein n=1 Tax=Coralloluteibacterium thermophilum TaxID=2707049 RepID=A0ABV9NEZ9_9GAMM